MKILCKVARISQTPRQGEDGETLMTTHIKLTPVNLPGGDMQLSFSKADVEFHPGQILLETTGEKRGFPAKTMIHKDTLIVAATVYVKGEKAQTFRASDPGDPGHDGCALISLQPVAKREHREEATYEIEFTEVTA